MRLHEQILAGLAQLLLPILVVPQLVSGLEAEMGLLTAVYMAEFLLWEMHRNAANEAYQQGRRVGAQTSTITDLVSEPRRRDFGT